MQHFLSTSFLRPLLALMIFSTAACSDNEDRVMDHYKSYRFDTGVINRLPMYDSLVSTLLHNLPLFQTNNKEQVAFRYIPTAFETEAFKIIPAKEAKKINDQFTAIGNNYISGFEVFKDSTIKIYLRNYPSDTSMVDIEENLSYYPEGATIRKREFPVKDSMLNKHWQYWTRFNERSIF
jgi:hypothetical protein